MRKWIVALAYLIIFVVFTFFIFSSFGQNMLSTGRLSREHVKIKKCASCHEPFSGVTKAKCLKCHQSIKKEMAIKIGIHGTTAKNCFSCHPEHQGGNLKSTLRSNKFRHKNRSFFTGGHKESNCTSCHRDKKFLRLTTSCVNCHSADHEKEKQSNNNCSSCHFMTSWERLKINHASKANCSLCHQEPANHFRKRCLTCHSTKTWKEKNFWHPRVREHSYRSFSCSSCHPNGYDSYNCTKCHAEGGGDEGD